MKIKDVENMILVIWHYRKGVEINNNYIDLFPVNPMLGLQKVCRQVQISKLL